MRCSLHQWEIVVASQLNVTTGGQKLPCPFGHAFAEVTWPMYEGFDASQDESYVFMFACAIYGVIPYIVAMISMIELFLRRGTRELNFFGFVIFVTGLNESIFKRIVFQNRPERSCLITCGMPSGHSTMAIGLLTLSLLDTVRRVVHRTGNLVPRWTPHRWMSLPGFFCAEFSVLFSLLPLPSWDELSHFAAFLHSAIWFLLLYPVPLSRIALHDHTPEQVLMGSTVGFLEACVWWYFVQTLQHRHNHRLGQPLLSLGGYRILVHNFALPRFVVEQRVVGSKPVSQDPEKELAWYEDRTNERLSALCRHHHDEIDGSPLNPHDHRWEKEKRYLTDRQHRLRNLRLNVGLAHAVPHDA
mmetsp:Transcript_52758/g.140794  ORF Transcript_52758/g.140794 Transcript_52758/m.140794 type:complete len:357 (-) Transcript_52758:93-1163(-)